MKYLIRLFATFFVIAGLAFGVGYVAGRCNILSNGFINYNIPSYQETLQNGLPNVIETVQTPVVFADSGTPNNHTLELVNINVANLGSHLGLYVGGNSIYVSELDQGMIGHELCHLIISRYGVWDVVQNEQICYTINKNYKWTGIT